MIRRQEYYFAVGARSLCILNVQSLGHALRLAEPECTRTKLSSLYGSVDTQNSMNTDILPTMHMIYEPWFSSADGEMDERTALYVGKMLSLSTSTETHSEKTSAEATVLIAHASYHRNTIVQLQSLNMECLSRNLKIFPQRKDISVEFAPALLAKNGMRNCRLITVTALVWFGDYCVCDAIRR